MNDYEALTLLGAKWSDDLKTIKTLFCSLALKHHPDVGGDEETMKQLNVAYEYLRLHHQPENGPHYSETDRDHVRYKVDPIVMEKAVKVMRYQPNLDVSIAGAWVWVEGDTKPVKEFLKSEGFRWAPKKAGQPWYFAGCKSFSRRNVPLDDIFRMYGKREVEVEHQERLGA